MLLNLSDFDEKLVDNYILKKSALNKLIESTSDYSGEEFLKKYPVLGKRAYAIKGGLLIAQFSMNLLDIDSITVSTKGLRYGTVNGLVN